MARSSVSWSPACAPDGRCGSLARATVRRPGRHVTTEVLISERPAEAEDRAVPGHWEGDLIIGLQRSAIGTLVERTTRFTMLVHLPREEGYGTMPRTKNGPALAGYGAVTMKNALADTMTTLPEQLRRSLTWDRGKELSAHAAVQGRDRHPGLLRRPAEPLATRHEREHQRAPAPVLPQRHRPLAVVAEEIEAVAHALNTRPRKTLGWKTPAEAFDEQLRLLQQAGVATID